MYEGKMALIHELNHNILTVVSTLQVKVLWKDEKHE